MRKIKSLVSYLLAVSLLLQLLIPFHAFAGSYDPGLSSYRSSTGSVIYPHQVINDFNTEDQAALWSVGSNASEVNYATAILNTPGVPFEGAGVLEVVPDQVKAYEWRTIHRIFPEPLDLSDANFIAVAANIWGWKQDDYYLKMTLTSGIETYETVSNMSLKWNVIYFDIHSWANKNNIDKIEFSYMKNYDLDGMSPGEAGYEYWDGRLQLDYLSATQAANLDFNVTGVTEGFVAAGGTAAVHAASEQGTLEYKVEQPASTYLESPGLNLNATKRNMIELTMRNNTGADQLKVSWITDQDQNWDEGKTMLFHVANSSTFTDYRFGMSSSLWKDTIDKIRISPVMAANESVLDIDRISFSLQALDTYDYQGKVDTVAIHSDLATITVAGSIQTEYLADNPSAEIMVFELPLYADVKTADYSAMNPLDTGAATEQFRMSFNAAEAGISRIQSKFAVVLTNGDGSYVLADTAKYVTNPEIMAVHTYPYTPTKSIKGQDVMLLTDAERQGAQHGAINIPYNQFLTLSDHGDSSIPYEYEGKTYYFRKNVVHDFDNKIKSMTVNGMAVTGILILQRTGMDDPDSPNKDLIHPDSTPDGTVFAPNLTNEAGVNYYKAITSFLAERYSREDKAYGRIMGFIVGNEIGNNKVWNNMGPKLMENYMEQYERTLRLTYNLVKSQSFHARVYISLDHFWNDGHAPDAMWAYANKNIVDTLGKITKDGGDYGWNVAFHPYPEDLFNPRTWADVTATDSFDTYRITFRNLQVLTNYLQQERLTFNGLQRHVILSEQGFHSGTNTLEDQKVQAAAYAYAYYKVKSLPGIDAFILSRHVDHAGEGGLNLGMWTNLPGHINDAGQQKLIYDVFRKIDTVDSLAATEFAKTIIGVSDWNEIIPGFDTSMLDGRAMREEAPMGTVSAITGEVPLSDFDNDRDGWQDTDNVAGIMQEQSDMVAGAGSLRAMVAASPLKDFKGVTKPWDIPIDMSATPVIKAFVKAVGIGEGEQAEFMFRAYSGDRVMEGMTIADADTWNEIGLDLGNWEGAGSVDRIKIWARPEKAVAWAAGALLIDEVSMAASAALTNLVVTVDYGKALKIGDKLTIHIRNKGNQTYTGTVVIAGLNGIDLDKSGSPISIGFGEQTDIQATITGLDIEDYKSGKLQLTVGGSTYIYELTEAYLPDYTLVGNDVVLGDFEGGYTDGWNAGSHTASVASVQKDSTYQAFPAAANHGLYMLESAKAPEVATKESVVYKTFALPLDLSNYGKINYSLYGWGGTSSAYVTKIKLTAFDGTTFEFEQDTSLLSEWTEVSADISQFAGKSKVRTIEISYRGKDLQFHAGPWVGFFYIDHVRVTDLRQLTAIIPDKAEETLALINGKMQLVIRGIWSDGNVKQIESAAEGTVYEGYDEAVVSVSDDGLVKAMSAGDTAITVRNGEHTATIHLTVSAELPESMYSFETGLEGWEKSDPGDPSIVGVKSVVSAEPSLEMMGTPKPHNGGRMLEAGLADISPDASKMVGVNYDPPLDLTSTKDISYAIFSAGEAAGLPGEDGLTATEDDIAVSYISIFKLTSTSGETFIRERRITPNSWMPITIDIAECTFRGSVAKLEIGQRIENAGLSVSQGKFFVDNISKTSVVVEPESPPVTKPGVVSPSNDIPISLGNGKVFTMAKLDQTSSSLRVSLESPILEQAFASVEADASGVKTLILEVPAVSGARSYFMEFAAGFLMNDTAKRVVSVKTGLGTIHIPDNMLPKKGTNPVSKITIRIEEGVPSALSKEANNWIGNRKSIKLSLLVDGKPLNWNNPNAKVKVSIPYKATAEEQKELEHIIAIDLDDKGNVAPIPSGRYASETEEVSFMTNHFSQFATAFVKKKFNDIEGYPWAVSSIEILASKGILKGTSTAIFSPQKPITRGEYLVMLVNGLGLSAESAHNFDDVQATDFYFDAVGIGKALGIAEGISGRKFNPMATLTRQDMIVLSERAMLAANKLKPNSYRDLSRFKDEALVSEYSRSSIANMAGAGLIEGSNGWLKPGSEATRVEAAVLIYRLYQFGEQH
ncbi:DUF5722 domain-containing protein [Paenibacillus paridis]|uniref:DUF5722 domain-containing protein n=1 Tax=Paenibacillus paridis TaxID=2583376 RepID=UPI00111E9048|nr:DUF5722 domain-containing protein [Paenibacillus paridis]